MTTPRKPKKAPVSPEALDLADAALKGAAAAVTHPMKPQEAVLTTPSTIQAKKAITAIEDSAVTRAKHALLPDRDGTVPSIYPALNILWNAAMRVDRIRTREGIS
jgi:hypothetical protein